MITKAHSIQVNPKQLLNPGSSGFADQTNWTVIDAARWLAEKGLETADKIVFSAQNKIRSCLLRGGITNYLYVKEAVWVSKWLLNVKHIPAPTSEDNWFESVWAKTYPKSEPSRVKLPYSFFVHVGHLQYNWVLSTTGVN